MVTKHSDAPPEKQRSSQLVLKSTQKNQQVENSHYKDRNTDRKTDRQTDRQRRAHKKVKRKVNQNDKQANKQIIHDHNVNTQ